MNPTNDPDIVPLADTTDCSSVPLYDRVGYGRDALDFLHDWWWDNYDTLDTDGDPE